MNNCELPSGVLFEVQRICLPSGLNTGKTSAAGW